MNTQLRMPWHATQDIAAGLVRMGILPRIRYVEGKNDTWISCHFSVVDYVKPQFPELWCISFFIYLRSFYKYIVFSSWMVPLGSLAYIVPKNIKMSFLLP